ncbi:MAG: hypothetical protein AB1634_15430, partial [Thermodesulfobacteriota bacterium]
DGTSPLVPMLGNNGLDGFQVPGIELASANAVEYLRQDNTSLVEGVLPEIGRCRPHKMHAL